VPPENSVSFYLALRAAKVPAELHIYERGGHGFGMRADRCVAAGDWPKRCADWLRAALRGSWWKAARTSPRRSSSRTWSHLDTT